MGQLPLCSWRSFWERLPEGLFTFGYARGASYLTDDPAACANWPRHAGSVYKLAKVESRQGGGLQRLHAPRGFIPKYATKAINGFFHSLAFTTRHFPDEIRITERNFRVAESACLKCLEDVVTGIRSTREHRHEAGRISCHNTVGHM